MVERFLSGDNLDNYSGPTPVIYMTGDEQLPENTKIRVLFGKDNFMEYQLDRQDAVYGIDDVLITKMFLLPVSAQH